MMHQCDEHVYYQLPKKLTYVNFLIDAIKCNDHGINSAIAMVKGDKRPTAKMIKFEDAAAYLTPWYTVSENRNKNRKRGAAEISNTSGR